MSVSADDLKRAAGYAAAGLVEDGMVVGLGSGTTLVYMIRRLGERVRGEGLRIVGVPTSYQARSLALELGIPIREAMDVSEVDLALDGADEIDPAGVHLKGAGAAQVIEKIIAAMARRYVLVADESKPVRRLGEKWPVVAEVVMPAMASAMRRFERLGGPAGGAGQRGEDGAGDIGSGQPDCGRAVRGDRRSGGSGPGVERDSWDGGPRVFL